MTWQETRFIEMKMLFVPRAAEERIAHRKRRHLPTDMTFSPKVNELNNKVDDQQICARRAVVKMC